MQSTWNNGVPIITLQEFSAVFLNKLKCVTDKSTYVLAEHYYIHNFTSDTNKFLHETICNI